MMKRRTDTAISTQKLFVDVLYSPLDWPWKSVRLERNSLLDYRQRPASANMSVAEFYHANSKLFPQMLPELIAPRVQLEEFRREAIHRRAIEIGDSHAPALILEPYWHELLTAVVEATSLELFYAVELRMIIGESLGAHDPVTGTFPIVKQLSIEEQQELTQALGLLVPQDQPLLKGPLLVILGRFACNDILFGARGYRRTLLEAGQVAQAILHTTVQLNVTARPVYEFVDQDVDAVMEADGIEEGTVMVFELGRVADVG